ncbi:MAG TPA: hypothetical protein VFO38_02920 [Candidatus Saccharimonadales bacterium]|nr:hypothetical protein [Candidatus Saccharimonadales bacterium]
MQTFYKRKQKGFGAVELIIFIVVMALLIIGGWYIWQAQTTKNETTNNPQDTTNSKSIYKIPEFGVEFDIKDGIIPIHKVIEYMDEDGKTYPAINMSTQQLVEKGADVFSGQQNLCSFVAADGVHVLLSLITVRVFASQEELLAVEPKSFGPVIASDIKPTNGFITIGDKLFHAPQQPAIRGGSCLSGDNAAFETRQREALQQSLLTLRKSK